jgi:biotin synthase-like enzyme
MVEKVGIVSARLCTAQCIFCVQNTKRKQKIKFKSFLHRVERSCISKVQNTSEPNSAELQWPERKAAPRGPKQEPPPPPRCRLFGDLSKHKVDKIVAGGEGKKKYPARQCIKHVRNVGSEVKLRTSVNSALLRFTKGLVWRDTTH